MSDTMLKVRNCSIITVLVAAFAAWIISIHGTEDLSERAIGATIGFVTVCVVLWVHLMMLACDEIDG